MNKSILFLILFSFLSCAQKPDNTKVFEDILKKNLVKVINILPKKIINVPRPPLEPNSNSNKKNDVIYHNNYEIILTETLKIPELPNKRDDFDSNFNFIFDKTHSSTIDKIPNEFYTNFNYTNGKLTFIKFSDSKNIPNKNIPVVTLSKLIFNKNNNLCYFSASTLRDPLDGETAGIYCELIDGVWKVIKTEIISLS